MSVELIVVVGVIVLVVGGAIWYEKIWKPKHPTSPLVATVNADWAAIVARVDALEGRVGITPAKAATLPPAGRSGVAGTFTVQVTGNPQLDIPAMVAAYSKAP